MTDLSQIAASTRDSIGRYFSLVSAVPSALLVAWTILLLGSGAWEGEPDPVGAVRFFGEVGVGGAVGLAVASIALGVVLHPMQFAFVQILEGYWGASSAAQRAFRLRARGHWRRVSWMLDECARVGLRIHASTDPSERAELTAYQRELMRLRSAYPEHEDAFMPTRLGNVLRRYEDSVGLVYGIEPIETTPYLASVSTPADLEYLDDQRSQLDLAVRMTIVALIATVLSALFLARHGFWLLVVLGPYAAVYLSYRGAVIAAAEYGRAIGVLVTLNRFALYERLQLPRPESTEAERQQNVAVMHLLSHTDAQDVNLQYRPAPPDGDPGE